MQEWVLQEENPDVLLHDCVISDAGLEDGTLTFVFEDGIWLLAETEHNPSCETIRTGKASVKIRSVDETQEASGADICIGTGLLRMKRWKYCSLEEIIRQIRSGKTQFEILSMHRDAVSVLFSGVCHMRKAGFFNRYEYFYWKVQTKKKLEIHFEWGGVRPDCTW